MYRTKKTGDEVGVVSGCGEFIPDTKTDQNYSKC